jgi:hypothetical protein
MAHNIVVKSSSSAASFMVHETAHNFPEMGVGVEGGIYIGVVVAEFVDILLVHEREEPSHF